MAVLNCALCGKEVACERFPFGYACVCRDEDCANHEAVRFHLTPEAAQKFWDKERGKA